MERVKKGERNEKKELSTGGIKEKVKQLGRNEKKE